MRVIYCLLLGLLSFSTIAQIEGAALPVSQSQPVPKNIVIVSYNEKWTLCTEITLSNGTTWIYSGINLFSSPSSWRTTDRVEINYANNWFTPNQFYLFNIESGCALPVQPRSFTEANLSRVKKVDIAYGRDKQILMQKLTLDNSSTWYIQDLSSWGSNDKTIKTWQPNDRLLISPVNHDKVTHVFYNLDRKGDIVSIGAVPLDDSADETVESKGPNRPADLIFKIQSLSTQGDKTLLTLNNGMSFEGDVPSQAWGLNDSVSVKFNWDKKWVIEHLSHHNTVKATLLNTDSIAAPRIEWINGNYLYLDDHSVWFRRYPEKDWNVNDRIFITPNRWSIFYMETHRLVNLEHLADGITCTEDVAMIKKPDEVK
jgi:hypothetical protein